MSDRSTPNVYPSAPELVSKLREIGSVPRVADHFDIPVRSLRDHFAREGLKPLVDEALRIHKQSTRGGRAEDVTHDDGLDGLPSSDYVEIPVIYRDYTDRDHLYVYPLGDVHKGAPAHDATKWTEWLDYLRSSGRSMIGTGDFLNSALKDSKSESYDESLTVGKAKRPIARELEGVCIDVLMPGNHERRIYRAVGDCPIEDIADRLDTPYAADSAVLIYDVGDQRYTVYLRHGTGGGGGIGAQANRLQKQSQAVMADVYISGHTHRQMVFPEDIFVPDFETRTMVRRSRYFVSSGSFLRYEGYAAAAAYAPTKLGAPRLFLDGRRHDVHGSL
jgi:predicted phosphodiesterase